GRASDSSSPAPPTATADAGWDRAGPGARMAGPATRSATCSTPMPGARATPPRGWRLRSTGRSDTWTGTSSSTASRPRTPPRRTWPAGWVPPTAARAACHRRSTRRRAGSGARRARSGWRGKRAGDDHDPRHVLVRQLPQAETAALPARARAPLARGRPAGRRYPHAGIPGEEPQRQGAGARARRRPGAGGVERDPALAGRRHPLPAVRSVAARPGTAVDVLRAVQPRAVHRGGALHLRL